MRPIGYRLRKRLLSEPRWRKYLSRVVDRLPERTLDAATAARPKADWQLMDTIHK